MIQPEYVMSGLAGDGTTELVSRDQILDANGDREKTLFFLFISLRAGLSTIIPD